MAESRMHRDGGRYTFPETARYAGVPTATVRSWFVPRAVVGEPLLLLGNGSVDGKHVVSFLGLIESYVAGRFRAAGVKLPALLRAHDLLRAELGTVRPFAHADLPTRGRAVLSRHRDQEWADIVSAPDFFGRMSLDKVQYDSGTRLAVEWQVGRGVAIALGVGAGDPIVDGSGVKSYILAAQYHANGDNARVVADLYHVSVAAVLDAAAFEDGLGRRPAA